MICKTCGTPVVFGPAGWDHSDAAIACPRLAVEWPPPGNGDDD
ncbi:MAG: hypothetical protein R3290_00545 [Acidimicrobiia bacterium]|nr:hypothetical protein [Acidimicrobiia bacterium]